MSFFFFLLPWTTPVPLLSQGTLPVFQEWTAMLEDISGLPVHSSNASRDASRSLTLTPHPCVFGTNLNITSLRNKEAFSGPDTRAASAACCHSCPPHGGRDAAPHTIHFRSSTRHPRRKGKGLLSPVLLPTLHPAPSPAPRLCLQHNGKYWRLFTEVSSLVSVWLVLSLMMAA